MNKIRVALIHNIIAPYRHKIFEALSQEKSLDLHVYFCSETHGNRKWPVRKSKNYKNEVLNGITIQFGSEMYYHINLTILSILIREKFDLVIIGGSTDFTNQIAFLLSKIQKTPILLWTEGIENAESTLGKVIRPMKKYVIKNSDALIVPSTKSRDYHVKMGANPKKIFISPNIVDNEYFIQKRKIYHQNKELYKKNISLCDKKIILFVGSLIERKGLEFLLKAYKILKNKMDFISLVIVGEGVLKNELQNLCTKEKIKDVHFTGWLDEDKIMYYGISDVFVIPSLEDLCPLVINEAMCCELPVISTIKVGCALDMIKEGKNGFVVEDKNVNQLYESLEKVLNNDPAFMGKCSLEIIKTNYTTKNVIEGFLSAIEYSLKTNENYKSL
jgi:glycosyltransferase involved in cell wall biosynthesis